MNTITYTNFNEKPKYYLDEIAETNLEAIILKNGKPYIKILPLKEKENPLKNSIVFEHDIISPIEVEWEANK